jgi:large subunit ribosomal protein L13
LGRLATQVAVLLRGKNKPTFSPHVDCGDFVIVLNASKVKLSGKKETDKIFYRHTGFPGGIKATPASKMRADNPEKLIRDAVEGMLPKNRLSRQLITKLKVYPANDHPHEAQQAEVVAPLD